MAALSDRLPPDALPNMARLFGIGVDFVIPGQTTITGTVPLGDTASICAGLSRSTISNGVYTTPACSKAMRARMA